MPITKTKIAAGVVHELSSDLEELLIADVAALTIWENLTPLARNEWICWIENAKRHDTRQKRITRSILDIKSGKKRPCCYPGCNHRVKNQK